ncbi:MAG: hypothetical protein GY822_17295 [Deltaproteobacteria bacterium]|nr:hypothetical protein [Deltaproteobacteria bacterium]
MICPKCGRPIPDAAVICPGCDFILDTDFLGTEILDEDKRLRPGMGGIDPEVFNLADAAILGDMDEKNQVFDTQDTGFNVKETTSARLYVTGSTQAIMAPDAVPAKTGKSFNKRKLTPFERHLLGYIDGVRPVEVIEREAGLDDAEVKTALVTLTEKGLVKVIGRALVEIEPMQISQGAARKKRTRYHPDIVGAVALVGDDAEQAIDDSFSTQTNLKRPKPSELKGPPSRNPLHRPETDVFSRLIDDGGELRLVDTREHKAESPVGKAKPIADFPVDGEGFTGTTKRELAFKKPKGDDDLNDDADGFELNESRTDALEKMKQGAMGLHSPSLLLNDVQEEVKTRAAIVDTSGLFNSLSDSDGNFDSDSDFAQGAFSSNEGAENEGLDDGNFDETTRAPPGILQQALLRRTKLGQEPDEKAGAKEDEVSETGVYVPEGDDDTAGVDANASAKPKQADSSARGVFGGIEVQDAAFSGTPMTDPAATALLSKKPDLKERVDGGRVNTRKEEDAAESSPNSMEFISESMVISPGGKKAAAAKAAIGREAAFSAPADNLDSDEEAAMLSEGLLDDSEESDAAEEASVNLNALLESGELEEEEGTAAYDGLLDEDGFDVSVSDESGDRLSADGSVEPRPFAGRKRSPVEQKALKKKAARLFADAKEDFKNGRIGAARMNAKLASIYDHENAEYKNALSDWERPQVNSDEEVLPDVRLYERAQEAEAKGLVDEAMSLLREGLEENPDVPAIHNRLGVLLALQKRDYSKAAEFIRKAIELEPDNLHYKNSLEKILSRMKRKQS